MSRIGAGLVLVACVLSACQTDRKAVSLEEAKKITLDFASRKYDPPPRSISDITALLDREKPDPAKAAAARAAADRQPAPGLGDADLAKFYHDRSIAAGEVGRWRQRIADLELAERHATAAGAKLSLIKQQQSFAEAMAGRLRNALQLSHERLEVAEREGNKRIAPILSKLVLEYVRNGDLAGARTYLGQLEANHAEMEAACAHADRPFCSRVYVVRGLADGARARLLQAEGKFAEAEVEKLKEIHTLERFRQVPDDERAATESIRDHVDFLTSELAFLKLRQGRLIEAEIDARRGLISSLRANGKYSAQTARLLVRFEHVIFEQGRYAEAEALARASLDILGNLGAEPASLTLARAKVALANALTAQRKWPDAAAIYGKLESDLADEPLTLRLALAGNLNNALAKYRSGRVDAGLQAARATYDMRRGKFGEDAYLTAEARGFVGMGRALTGAVDEAIADFRAAVPVLLAGAHGNEHGGRAESARSRRLGILLEAYLDLLSRTYARNVADPRRRELAAEAFRIAAITGARTVQAALSASAARAAIGDPALADLARREQDFGQQIDGLTAVLQSVVSAPSDQQDPKAIEALRERIALLGKGRQAIAAEIAARFPAYADLANPPPMTMEEVRQVLSPGEALLLIHVAEARTYVWAVPPRGEVAFAETDLGREDIADWVASLRLALQPAVQTVGDIPPFNLSAAWQLYERLLAPVKAGWEGSRNLIVVGDGPVGNLPLAVLPTREVPPPADKGLLFAGYRDVPWLARTHAVTNLPSVASLAALRRLPAATAGRQPFVGFGDPLFERNRAAGSPPAATGQLAARGAAALRVRGMPLRLRAVPQTGDMASAELARLPRLPDTADEIVEIAASLRATPAGHVFVGEAASEQRVKAMDLSATRVVAFATHGLLPGELDGLDQPALALSSPAVVGSGEDGLLTMTEILGLRLNADWVVLSACNTGSGGGQGAEAVSGLGRAFFYAGTRALLVTHWPVETTSARALTTGLFRVQAEQPGLTRAEALRRTMLQLIDGPGARDAGGAEAFSYAHPLFWAPFSIIGDGGGAPQG